VPFTGSMVFANEIASEYIDYRRALPSRLLNFAFADSVERI